jgi:ABC-type Fe3+-hydroxamate transport system substrate-binding protein
MRPTTFTLALAAGALIAGCGSSSTTPSASTASPVTTSTVKTNTSVAPAPKTPSVPKTRSVPVVKVPKRVVIKTGPVLKSLSGDGDKTIGTLTASAAVVLEWSTTKAPIQIFNGHGFVLVNSSSGTGEVRLARGKYTDMHVATTGRWTITLRRPA